MAIKDNKILLLVLLAFVAKLLVYVIKMLSKAIANVIVYLGMYIPFFYCVFALMMYGLFNLDFQTLNPNSTLILAGLVLSLVCAIIITIRNTVVRPFSSLFDFWRREEVPTYRGEAQRYLVRHRSQTDRYYEDDYRIRPEHHSDYRIQNDSYAQKGYGPEIPMIYYSEREPELLIHEYEDRFEVFRDDGRQPKRYLRTEYK